MCGSEVTVGALEAKVTDDSNSFHLLRNCRETMPLAESLLILSPVVVLMLAEDRLEPAEARFQPACCAEIFFDIFRPAPYVLLDVKCIYFQWVMPLVGLHHLYNSL